jgi:spermidine synthase
MAMKPTQAGPAGWVHETLYDTHRFSFKADKVLFEQNSGAWRLLLLENGFFGNVLLLDGITQVTERDEFFYHEMLAHVPMLAHGAAREVLIVGGGDCGLAEEVLKHPGLERLTQVEIDPSIIEFSRQYFASINAPVFEDRRFDLVIEDGAAFVAQTERRFDVVLVDSTDPVGPGAALFTAEFYAGAKRCLAPGGILVTQNGVPFMQRDELVTSMARLEPLFTDAYAYVVPVPTYVGGPMTLGWACDDPNARKLEAETLARRFEAAAITTRYYTPEVHRAAFALPRFIRDAVEEGLAAGRTGGERRP